MSDDEDSEHEIAEYVEDVLLRGHRYDSHKHVRVIERARHWTGEIILEVEVCDRCGQRTPKLEWLTCDEWIIKSQLE